MLPSGNFRSPQFVEDHCITVNDVLLGRGAFADRFEGNIRFRTLVRLHKDMYIEANHRNGKAIIAQQVVDAVHVQRGRFLRRVPAEASVDNSSLHSNLNAAFRWEIVENAVAVEKAKQAFRDIHPGRSKASQTPIISRGTSAGSEGDQPSLNESSNPGPVRQGGEGDLAVESNRPEQHRLSRGGLPEDQRQAESQLEEHRRTFPRQSAQAVANGQLSVPRQAPTDRAFAVAMDATTNHPIHVSRETAPSTILQHVQGFLEGSEMQAQGQRLNPPELLPASAFGINTFRPTDALSESRRNEVAMSWPQIPGAYLNFLPLVRDGAILAFGAEDLQIILLTLTWAELAPDVACINLIRLVMNTIVTLPPQKLQLTRYEMACLFHAMQTF